MPTTHLIAGRWLPGVGPERLWQSPATGQVVWTGKGATAEEVTAAVDAARGAFADWAARPIEERIAIINAFAHRLQARREDIARAIGLDTGKPRWESATEVDAMIAKVGLSIEANQQRRKEEHAAISGANAAVRYKPHGVVAVLGPFNLPAHLPNGHIVPALLAGNTVVFKPSEQAPLTGQVAAECWQQAGLPAGVLNLVQGARETGAAIASHPGIDGIYFTGSAAAGKAISRASADRPDKILALEMGGNNPLIAWPPVDIDAAAVTIILSAFITAGQRCTCARRLIVPQDAPGDELLRKLAERTRGLRVGPPDAQPEPFIGPVISPAAAEAVLKTRDALLARGGKSIVACEQAGERITFLRPGIIDVTAAPARPDAECFGPLLQVIRVPDFAAAMEEANRTAFGLAAGLLCDDPSRYETFFREIRAGIVNWNHQTTGASSRLPFGGVGGSGNHRPAGFWSADYCSYPVASLESEKLTPPGKLPPGVTDEP